MRMWGLMWGRTLLGVAAALAVGTALPSSAGAALLGSCSQPTTPGGDWPRYGGDLAGTRHQPLETGISTATAARLAPAWRFSTAALGDNGAFHSTPLVTNGCVFVATSAASSGTVYALDANTGLLKWRRTIAVPASGLGGTIVGAPVVDQGRVIVLVSRLSAPYAVALDINTGAVLWESAPFSTYPTAYTNASPIVFGGVVVAGFSPPEGDSNGQGGWALIDAATGAMLGITHTVPPADQAQGYAGGGIWTTPAVDPATGHAYIGAGNPFSKTKEHPYTNAILKVDLDRTRPTFGTVVASYKGNIDQYTEALQFLSETEACRISDIEGFAWPLDDPVCGQLDLDFGASANLFRDASGRLLVGELQKAGIYHVADATTMAPAWHTLVNATCQACNAGSTAVDANGVAGVGAPGGIAFSLDRTTGARRWLSPLPDTVHFQGTSTANGVMYTVDGLGFLTAFDAATGGLLLKRPTGLDTGLPGLGIDSNGIAIANRTVYAAVTSGANGGVDLGGHLIAYRPKP